MKRVLSIAAMLAAVGVASAQTITTPADAATRPRARRSLGSERTLFNAPRTLNEPVRCRFSSLRNTSVPELSLNVCEKTVGVRRMYGETRTAAARRCARAVGKS